MSELCVVTQRSGPLTKTYTTDRFRLVSWAGEQQCRGSPALPSMWSSSAEKLELYLALFGYLGVHYVLTFDDAHLPASFEDVKRCFAAFCKRVRRFDPSIRRYCKVDADDAELPGYIDAAEGYLLSGVCSKPEDGTPRFAMYLLCVKALTLEQYDRRGISIDQAASENRVVRLMLNQLKLTEPVPESGTGEAAEGGA